MRTVFDNQQNRNMRRSTWANRTMRLTLDALALLAAYAGLAATLLIAFTVLAP